MEAPTVVLLEYDGDWSVSGDLAIDGEDNSDINKKITQHLANLKANKEIVPKVTTDANGAHFFAYLQSEAEALWFIKEMSIALDRKIDFVYEEETEAEFSGWVGGKPYPEI